MAKITMTAQAGSAEILIYGEITAEAASTFDADLKALGSVRTLTVRINSPGGDVFAGNAIFAMLSRHPAKKIVFVDGVAASMGSLIAMAGDRIVMAENAMLMIHNPAGIAIGGGAEMARMKVLLDDVRDGMGKAYARRSGIPLGQVFAMMDAETWFTAEEAVARGFADEVEGVMRAAAMQTLAGFDFSKFKHAPALPKDIRAYAEQYWAKRGRAAPAPAMAQPAAASDLRSPCRGSLAPDLVASSIDNRAVWSRRNSLGGVIARMPIAQDGER